MDRVDHEEDGLAVRRLFSAAPLLHAGDMLALGEAAAQHARVLRLAPGDDVELFDGRGHTVTARLERMSKRDLTLRALGPVSFHARGPELVLVQCLPKGRKLDDIVRMTTELGVAAIHLAVSERSVVQKSTRDDHKSARLARIAREAARQAEQAYVPEIIEPVGLEQALARAPDDAQRAVLLERSTEPFSIALSPARLWLVVGPEGGFSSRDREILSYAKFTPQGLGRAILRTETAAVVGVGLGISALWRGR